nr:MAG TPA: hypothetical protein [Caudoviricetes sp.]DAH81976.1 MAG TPA: hypothetical protein [Caudoviricetes sp.]
MRYLMSNGLSSCAPCAVPSWMARLPTWLILGVSSQ